MRADASELELQLYGTPVEKEVAGPVRDVAVRFTLRASGLPALDRNLFSKDSSDPYYKLKARDGNGFLHLLGKSKVISKNLNPEWEPVEVSAATLGRYRQLHVEIWDHDVGLDDDQIGVVDFELPQDLGAALGDGALPLEKTFPIPAHPLTGPLADLYADGAGTLEGSYTLVEGGAAPAAAAKKMGIFGRKPIISPPPSPPADLEAAEISELKAELADLRKDEAVLYGEVVRLKTGGMLECREAVAAACRTVEEDEKRKAEEAAAKKKAPKKKGGMKKGLFGRLKKGISLDAVRLSAMDAVDDLVHDAMDDLAGVGDDFDEESGRGGTRTSEVVPVDMSDETLAWPRFVPVIRLIRRRARSDCCSWANKNAQAFFTVKYQQEVAECEVQREQVVTSPLEVHEKLRVHYQRQLMRGWPHAKIMTQFSDVGCGLIIVWKRCKKFTGGYSEAKLKVVHVHLHGHGHVGTCECAHVHIMCHVARVMCMCMFSTGPAQAATLCPGCNPMHPATLCPGCNPMHPCFSVFAHPSPVCVDGQHILTGDHHRAVAMGHPLLLRRDPFRRRLGRHGGR